MIDHYENPRKVGKLDAKKKNVGTGLVGAPACGDVMRLQIEVNESYFKIIFHCTRADLFCPALASQDNIFGGAAFYLDTKF